MIADQKRKMIRVRIPDSFMVSACNVRRINALDERRFDYIHPSGNPHIMAKEVQDWLLANAGYDLGACHIHDRYYYNSDDELPDLRMADLSQMKIPRGQRRWKKSKERVNSGIYERFVLFFPEDEEIALEFLLRFGEEITREWRMLSSFLLPK